MVAAINPNGAINNSDSFFKGCESAYNLIRDGYEKDAKEKFPLEFYLIKKYFYLSLEDFLGQLSEKLELR